MGWHSGLEQQTPCSFSSGSARQVSVSRPTVSSPAPRSPVVGYRHAAHTSTTPGNPTASGAGRSHDSSRRQSSSQSAGSQSGMKTVRSVCFPMPGSVPLSRSPSLSADIDAWNRLHFVEDDDAGSQNAGGVLQPPLSAQVAWYRALEEQRLGASRSSTGSIGIYGTFQATSIGIKPITIEPTHIKSPEPMNSLSRPLEFKPLPENSSNPVGSNALQPAFSQRALRTSDRPLTKEPSSTSPDLCVLQRGEKSPSGTKLGSGTILSRPFTLISPQPFEPLRRDTPLASLKSPYDLAQPLSPVSVDQSSKKKTSQSKPTFTSSREIQPSGFPSITSQSLLQQHGKLRRETLPLLTPAPQITSLDYAARRAGSLRSICAPKQIEVSSIKASLTGATTPLPCAKNVSSSSLKTNRVEAKSTTPMPMKPRLSTRAINVSRKKQGSAVALKEHSPSLTALETHPLEADAVTIHRSHSQQFDSTEATVPKN